MDEKFGYKIQKCVQTKRNRETNTAFWKHFSSKFIKLLSEITKNSLLKWCALSFHILAYVPWSFVSCFVWDMLRLSPVFWVHCMHHFHDFAYSKIFMHNMYTEFALTQPLYESIASQTSHPTYLQNANTIICSKWLQQHSTINVAKFPWRLTIGRPGGEPRTPAPVFGRGTGRGALFWTAVGAP